MLSKISCYLAVVLLPFAATAAVANVVIDGGFEGDISQNYSAPNYFFHLGPSTFGPWSVNNGFVYIDGFSQQAHSGNNSLNLAPGNPLFPSDITQTLSTVAGTSYDLSFFAAAGGVNTFSVKFDGATVAGSPSSLPSTIPMFATDFTGDYLKYDFTVLATSDQSVLEFGGTSTDNPGLGPDTIQLDDISLAPVGVPEPITISLFSAGLAGLVAMRRRKKQQTA